MHQTISRRRRISIIHIRNLDAEEWRNDDLLEDCTNHAMRSDILRLEIVYRYGGIYVDVDATALRSFGPVFSRSFLSFRPANWTLSDKVFSLIQPNEYKIGSAGFDSNILGFPSQSNFLAYVLAALRENFPTQTATLYKTGPLFLVDSPGNADWDDGQDVRRKDKVASCNSNNLW